MDLENDLPLYCWDSFRATLSEMDQPAEYSIRWQFHFFTMWSWLVWLNSVSLSQPQGAELTSGHTGLSHSHPCSRLELGCGTKGSGWPDLVIYLENTEWTRLPLPTPLIQGWPLHPSSLLTEVPDHVWGLPQCRLIHVWAPWVSLELDHWDHSNSQVAIHFSIPYSCWPALSERSDYTGKQLSTPTPRCAGHQASHKWRRSCLCRLGCIEAQPVLFYTRPGMPFYWGTIVPNS